MLCYTITNLGKILKVPMQESDIKNVYKLNKRNDNKPMIVEFSSDIVRNKNFLGSAKHSRKTVKDMLTSIALGIEDPLKQIYI